MDLNFEETGILGLSFGEGNEGSIISLRHGGIIKLNNLLEN